MEELVVWCLDDRTANDWVIREKSLNKLVLCPMGESVKIIDRKYLFPGLISLHERVKPHVLARISPSTAVQRFGKRSH
jgi:hypothetical protein